MSPPKQATPSRTHRIPRTFTPTCHVCNSTTHYDCSLATHTPPTCVPITPSAAFCANCGKKGHVWIECTLVCGDDIIPCVKAVAKRKKVQLEGRLTRKKKWTKRGLRMAATFRSAVLGEVERKREKMRSGPSCARYPASR